MSKLTKKSMKRMKLSKLVFIKGLREIIKQYSIRKRKEFYAGNYNPDLAMKTYDFIPKLQQAEIQ